MSILVFLIVIFTAIIFIYLFIELKFNIDSGFLLGFYLFFRIYKILFFKFFPSVSFLMVLSFFSIIFILISFLSNNDKFITAFKKSELWWWIAFLLYLSLSFFWTNNPQYALYKLKGLLYGGFFPGLAIYFSYKVFNKFSWKPVLLQGMLFIIIFLLFNQISTQYIGRRTLEGINPIWIGRSALIVTSIAIFSNSVPILKKYSLALFGLIIGFLAQSKGPFIGFFGAIVYIKYFFKFKKNDEINKIKIKSLLKNISKIIVIIAFLAIFFNLTGFLRNTRFEVIFNIKSFFTDVASLDRIVRIIRAFKIFLNNIFLGSGLAGYSLTDIRNYPHNIILEILSELGIIGFGIWLIAICKTFLAAYKNKLILLLLIQSLIYAFLSGDLGANNEYLILSFLAIATPIDQFLAKSDRNVI